MILTLACPAFTGAAGIVALVTAVGLRRPSSDWLEKLHLRLKLAAERGWILCGETRVAIRQVAAGKRPLQASVRKISERVSTDLLANFFDRMVCRYQILTMRCVYAVVARRDVWWR
jgi:hypothetical protein